MKSGTFYDNLFEAQESNWKLGGLPDQTHATLMIYHPDLDPAELINLFSVTPSDFQVKGEPFAD